MSVKHLVIGLAIVIVIGLAIGFLVIYGYFNFTPDSNRTKAYFVSSPSPEQSPIWYFYGESYRNNALYGINLINNTTKPIYDVTIEYNIWLQYNNGTLTVDRFSAPKIELITPNSSVYTTSIPSSTRLYHMPPDCTWIKTTVVSIYGYY